MMKNSSQLLKFTQACMRLATQRVPPYSSKFSKRTFTQPQLVVLYCLKIKLGVTYRELVDWLEEMPRLRQALGLKRLPHFTTVQKAFQRLSLAVWRVLQRISAAWPSREGVAALDASGWDRSHASRYYTQRIKLKLRALKTTLLVDTHAQTVLDLHLTTTRKHDTQIAPRLTERNLERFETLVADKGYDDQSYRNRLRSRGKRPLIKHREFKPADIAANARMDQALYHRRSLVETVISVLKRTYGDAVSSRVWWRQFRELVAMCLVYNVERAVKLGVTLLDWLLSRLLYFLQQRISTEPLEVNSRREGSFFSLKNTLPASDSGQGSDNLNSDGIVTRHSGRVKIAVFAPSGKRASPYRIEGRVLVKHVAERHIFRSRQAIGIDEAVWQEHKDRVQVLRFQWWDGRIFEISAAEFERKSFVHGDGLSFAKTLFVPLSALKLVRERPPARGQLSLFAGGST